MDNDHLRLWLRLRPLGTFSADSDSCNLIFTIGISSNFLVENKYEEVNGVIEQEMGRLASITDKSVLNKENFGGSPPNQPTMGWDQKGMADAGNMTGQDIAYYQLLYHQVISGE